jgi:anti-anti-sigma regulatory factor
MKDSLFTVQDGVLALSRNPELTEIDRVKAALLNEIDTNEGGGTLDMTSISALSSTTIGMVVAVHLRAEEAGRQLKTRIRQDQLRLFELTMLTETLTLEVAGQAAS